MIETQKSAISEYEQVIQNQQQTISEVTKQKTTLVQTLNSIQKSAYEHKKALNIY